MMLWFCEMSCDGMAGKSVGARTRHISQRVNDTGQWSFEAELQSSMVFDSRDC